MGGDGVSDNSTKNYELNISRSLAKKLRATKRVECLEFTLTSGGIVIEADAATFELTKEAALIYYSDHANAEVKTNTDRAGNVIEHIIKIEGVYTLNIYTTTSKLMVNGKNPETFLNNDAENINNLISLATLNGQPVNVTKLNALFAQEIQKHLPPKGYNNNKTKAIESVEIKLCTGCNKNVRSKGVLCETYKHWVHYKCEGISPDEIPNIEKSDEAYICKSCSKVADKPIPNVTPPK